MGDTLAARHSGGVHQWNVRKEEIAPYLKLNRKDDAQAIEQNTHC